MNAKIRSQWTATMASAWRLPDSGKHSVSAVVLLAITGFACLGASPETHDPSASDPQLRAERIEELKRAIEQEHTRLEDLITQPTVEDGAPLYDDPELREIAARLIEQEHVLEGLEAAAEADQMNRTRR